MLLVCPRWAFHRERLRDWMQCTGVLTMATGEEPPTWEWDFLVGSSGGRLWLGRFLVAVRPRWSMRDQFHSGSSDRMRVMGIEARAVEVFYSESSSRGRSWAWVDGRGF